MPLFSMGSRGLKPRLEETGCVHPMSKERKLTDEEFEY